MLLTQEIGFESGEQQTFAETTRTTEKVGFAIRCHAVDVGGFIYIEELLYANILKALYPDGELA